MKIDDFFKLIEEKHKPENADEECLDYPGVHESFDEGAALQQFRDCFAEDIK